MVEEGQNSLKQIRRVAAENKEDEDRISRLPDCLLVEILSHLPDTKYAIKTDALSKRWKHVWTSVPNLVFIHHEYNLSANFVSFVDKIISQRGQLNLKNLTFSGPFNHRFEPQVLNWIRYAINCNVEEINIMLWDPEGLTRLHIDQCFFINSYFTDLKLRACQFMPAGAISWKKLLSLHIAGVRLDEDLIENILSGSPVLETLVLEECYGYTRLNITSKSVKKFVFERYLYDTDVIEINAPTILSLAIKGYLNMKKLLLLNVSSLVEADLNYIPKETEEDMLKRFILDLRHVKELKIGTYCFKVLSRLEAKGFTVPSNLKLQEQVDATTSSSLEDDEPDA